MSMCECVFLGVTPLHFATKVCDLQLFKTVVKLFPQHKFCVRVCVGVCLCVGVFLGASPFYLAIIKCVSQLV